MNPTGFDVRPGPGNSWEVYNVETGETVEGGLDNQTAWRRVDRLMAQATNRGESVTDWLWSQRLKGG